MKNNEIKESIIEDRANEENLPYAKKERKENNLDKDTENEKTVMIEKA